MNYEASDAPRDRRIARVRQDLFWRFSATDVNRLWGDNL